MSVEVSLLGDLREICTLLAASYELSHERRYVVEVLLLGDLRQICTLFAAASAIRRSSGLGTL